MTDIELLELAAKAAGIEIDQKYSEVPYKPIAADGDALVVFNSQGDHSIWNPLTDDGEALRLAVKLSLDIHVDSNLTEVIYLDATTEAHLGDPYAATRRAIVRAAAEIGKVSK
jgi:hypothetical protein